MRNPIIATATLSAFLLAAPQTGADEPKADSALAEKPQAVARVDDTQEREFKPPDGWRPRKRGEFTVYCRKDYTPRGTRFPTEVCYDEKGIREMLQAQREDQASVDQARRIQGTDRQP